MVTIPIAFVLRSYWTLVIGQIVGRLAGTILTYIVQEYRPRFSLAARRDLLHFGKWLIVTNVLNFTSNRCADFLVARPREPGNSGFSISPTRLRRCPRAT
jgi:O-antigen/teichoic acid export membrane protein